ncbi:GNAT family N-acetyltransferase [Streptomyces tirandamycinicus]|uniref:GNAT family N-acetyltransferase n=1 Tax=Streptomyces tirandamycinicus TaxID=2174846 RepID=UPI0003720A55
MRIRSAEPFELPLLQDIERAAGEPFRSLGMAAIADDEPPPLEELERYRRSGGLWVTETADGRLVAYLLTEPVDGAAHIEQLSVHPDFARRGLGRDLIGHLATVAAAGGLSALTLTTFTEVPWNAPYYARLGFHALGEHELTEGLRNILKAEAAHGIDRWPRTCMRRPL